MSKQRCRAHLLRETRELESPEGQKLHQELKELRAWIEGKLGRDPPPGRRERLARFGEWAVQQLAERALRPYVVQRKISGEHRI